jgi:fructose/tagatose bisphosphate aldolase
MPLVLHGTTGVSDEDMKKAVQPRICKVNIGAALRSAFFKGMKAGL